MNGLRNLPARYSFVQFKNDSIARKKYFLEALLSNNCVKQMTWQRNNEDTMSLVDYVAE